MEKFNKLPYQRPDIDKLKSEFETSITRFEQAEDAKEQLACIEDIEIIKKNFRTMNTIAYIRNTIDTKDDFYDQEIEFFNETSPIYEELTDQFNNALLASQFRSEISDEYGQHIFNLIETQVKTISPEVLPELIEENKLSTEYTKLVASAQVDFEGKEYTLAQLEPFRQDKDRARRKAATEAYYKFFQKNETEFDRIYDDLVKVRTRLAQKLGYENFTELAYYRWSRTDYTAEDVKAYRDQVHTEVVPIVTALKDRQKKRLGLEDLKHYDESLSFNTGNPIPQGDPDWIINQTKTMYAELSPETNKFFNFMLDHELMDLLAKPGKESGGYCAVIDDYKAPFIFANFNGTQGDVEVMTHEAGHAFQFYESRDLTPADYIAPTLEAAEIHSMSMEFITWPWMDLFFGEQTEKFKFAHLSGAVEFIPYGVAVDEFQHWVYANPEVSPAERKAAWRKIEGKYQPHIDFDGFEYLEEGSKWIRQSHIFTAPFYYIDYTLAQICAFQFLIKSRENHETAWSDYLNLCQVGGSQPFLELLKIGKLENPFEQGSIAKVMPYIEEYLNSVDDLNM